MAKKVTKAVRLKNRLAAEKRWNPDATGTIEMLERELAEANIEDAIKLSREQYAPLTSEQVSRLCDLLNGGF